MEDYFGMMYKPDEHTRLFHFSKSFLHHEMDRGAKKAGVKRIRIHDLRHSAWEIVEPTKDNPQERSCNELLKQQALEAAPINRSADTVITTSHPSEIAEDIYANNLMDDENEEMLRSMGLA